MKRFILLRNAAIIAFAAIFGFAMMSCDDNGNGNGDPATITIEVYGTPQVGDYIEVYEDGDFSGDLLWQSSDSDNPFDWQDDDTVVNEQNKVLPGAEDKFIRAKRMDADNNDWVYSNHVGPFGSDPCLEHEDATITVTGLGAYDGKWAWITLYEIIYTSPLFYDGYVQISSGSVDFEIECMRCNEKGFVPGDYRVTLLIVDYDDNNKLLYVGDIESISIDDGTTMDFSEFEELDPCSYHAQATITITGLGEYDSEYALIVLSADIDGDSEFYSNWTVINNGSVELVLRCWECEEPGFEPGNYFVIFTIENISDETLYLGFIESQNITGNITFTLSDFTDLGDTEPEPGTLTITGLSAFAGAGFYIAAIDIDSETILAAENVFIDSPMAGNLVAVGVEIENGSVTLPVWEIDGPYLGPNGNDYELDIFGFSESGEITFSVVIWEGSPGFPASGQGGDITEITYGTVTVTFEDGVGTGVFVVAGGQEPSTLTITGLSEYQGSYIFAYAYDGDEDVPLVFAAESIGVESWGGEEVIVYGGFISGSTITLPVWDVTPTGDGDGMDTPFEYDSEFFTGNYTGNFRIIIWDGSDEICKTGMLWQMSFTNGLAEVTFEDGLSTPVLFVPAEG
ncbi:MAG: hypothetical protein FWD26_10635 [Treponema sp.]|nr:hypothetical protein [Treponema sp.]